jgi:hypothetical protein
MDVVCIARFRITVDEGEEMTPANLERIALNQMRDGHSVEDSLELLSWHTPDKEVN